MQGSSQGQVSGALTDRTRVGFCALVLGMLVAQLDTTIVVAALPTIGVELGARDAVAGVTAAYLLAVTVSTPVHGKLGDLLGRRPVFLAAVALFAVGSLACALAPTLPALIAARSVQGLGGGGLIVTAVAALGQMFSREELVRRQIWLTGATAVSALAGPPLGGLLAGGPGWPVIFLVNLPICAFAVILGLNGVPTRPSGAVDGVGMRDFDWAGAALLAIGGTAVVALGSLPSLANDELWTPMLALTAVCCAARFRSVERRAAHPLIPPNLFAVPALARSIAVTGLAGAALFGTFTFIPLAISAGTDASSGQIGVLLLALTGGQLVISTMFSVLARRYSRIVPWGRLALYLGTAGLLLIAAVPQLETAATLVAVLGMALAGASLGLSMQAFTLLGQTSAPLESFGAAMGTLTFARQLGGSIGAASFGWLLLLITDLRVGLSVVLVAAAGCLVLALLVAPHAADEPRQAAR